jgi:hypothetical protein
VATKTDGNSGKKASKSTPSYHGGKPGKLGFPAKSTKAPHDSATNGSGKSSKG